MTVYRRKHNAKGFTLAELMISMGLGLFISATAFTLAGHQSRLLGVTQEKTEIFSGARASLDQLGFDLRMSGSGVGYRPNNSFAGLMRGNFTVNGGASFQGNDFIMPLAIGSMPTDDVGIRVAPGARRTIAAFDGSTGQICDGPFSAGQAVVLMTANGMHARAVTLTAADDAACTDGLCTDGCRNFSWGSTPLYESDTDASTVSFQDGVMFANYREIVWFVMHTPDGRSELRRAVATNSTPCNARDQSCGGVAANDVETLQIGIWSWDAASETWSDQTAAALVQTRDRLRVDIEMVVRGEEDEKLAPQAPINLNLANGSCVPHCDDDHRDHVPRQVLRSSVHIRNSGRLSLQ